MASPSFLDLRRQASAPKNENQMPPEWANLPDDAWEDDLQEGEPSWENFSGEASLERDFDEPEAPSQGAPSQSVTETSRATGEAGNTDAPAHHVTQAPRDAATQQQQREVRGEGPAGDGDEAPAAPTVPTSVNSATPEISATSRPAASSLSEAHEDPAALPITITSPVYRHQASPFIRTIEPPFPTQDMLESDIRKHYVEIFGSSLVMQVEHELAKAVNQMVGHRPYFRERDVRRALMRPLQQLAEGREFKTRSGKTKVIPPDKVINKFLVHPEADAMIDWLIGEFPFAHLKIPGTLTTHEMLRQERAILDIASENDPAFAQPEDLVDAAIEEKVGISDEQARAVRAATLSTKRVTVIEGAAGSGKTYSMDAIKQVYVNAGYHVIGTALGWNAAKVLGEGAKLEDENCRALEGLTRSWIKAVENGSEPFQDKTLIIVDESGMVGTRHMSIVLEMAQRSSYPVKVILSGDSLQVNPVAAGNPMEMIIQFEGTTRIDTIRRQKQISQRQAVSNLSHKKAGPAIHTFLHQECFHWADDKDGQLNQVVRDFISYRLAHPDHKSLILAFTNADVLELNQRVRAAYRKLGLIGTQDIAQRVTDGRKSFESQFSVGDEVLLRANDQRMLVYDINEKVSPVDETQWGFPIRQGVFNRQSGRIVAIRRARKPVGAIEYIVDLEGDNPGRVIVNSETFKDPERPGLPMLHNYAGTIYGAQGKTVDHIHLIDNERLDFRLSYVGMSRHKGSVEVYLNESDLHRRLDKSLSRNPSMKARLAMDRKGKRMDDAVVETGRYTRKSMLQMVATTWSRHSDNLTCTMHELIQARGRKFSSLDYPDTKVKPEERTPWITDFVQEYNKPYPLVDLSKIMDLPDPIVESELVRASDAQINIHRHPPLEMPVDEAHTPMPLSEERADTTREHPGVLRRDPPPEQSFFARAASWIMDSAPWNKDKESAAVEGNGAPTPKSWNTPPSATVSGGNAQENQAGASGVPVEDPQGSRRSRDSESDIQGIKGDKSAQGAQAGSQKTAKSSRKATQGNNDAGNDSGAPVGMAADTSPGTPPRQPHRLADPTSAFVEPFVDMEGLEQDAKKVREASAKAIKKLNAWLRPRPRRDIPYETNGGPCGRIRFPESDPEFEESCRAAGQPDPRPRYLSFEGVPQVLNTPGGPNEEWVASKRGVMWDVGKGQEPRILAHDARGRVAARYRMDGTCVVGNGEPVAWVNSHGNETSPIYIVAGAKEWFWLRETMERRHGDTPEVMPHIVWAAKDTDWSLIAKDMRHSRKIVVVRSKGDDRQIPWARDMRDLLEGRFGLPSIISPELPSLEERKGPNRFALPSGDKEVPVQLGDVPQNTQAENRHSGAERCSDPSDQEKTTPKTETSPSPVGSSPIENDEETSPGAVLDTRRRSAMSP